MNNSVKSRFRDNEDGYRRIHQTADVVVLMLNTPMKNSRGNKTGFGVCSVYQDYPPTMLLKATQGKIVIFTVSNYYYNSLNAYKTL